MDDEVVYRVLETADVNLLNAAADLHIEHLSYRSFITLFGRRFIVELYKDMLADNSAFLVFALNRKGVCGFVLASVDSNKIFSSVKKKVFTYSKIILPRLLTSPKLIVKLFETFFYVKKENTDVKAELIVIVTDANNRSAGIGSKLVNIMNTEFLKRNVMEYKVTVHDEMTRSNQFYIKNGMTLATSFMMYNTKWNLYVKQLSK